jgi:hypothetical protein
MFAVVLGSGGFFPHLGRLITQLAPYLILPIAIILSFVLWANKLFVAATWSPLVLLAGAAVAGQLYRAVVPDPIVDNFGPRSAPYPGFLVLPPEAVPAGFREYAHHYTKQEYGISFRMPNDRDTVLSIAESPITQFMFDASKLVREFEHQRITGRVYASYNSRIERNTFQLVWLNPPRQRIAIFLSQRPDDVYSPDALINVLKSMRPAPGSQ